MNDNTNNDFIKINTDLLKYYKSLCDKAFEQVNDEDLFRQYNYQSNSIAIIIQHLSGNMLSRFTNFLTEDGEKTWRHRDTEFVPLIDKRKELIAAWENGWSCVFNALENLNNNDLQKIVYIRNGAHTVSQAILRQLAHYSYHAGQIIFIAKMFSDQWKSLSIPLNIPSTS